MSPDRNKLSNLAFKKRVSTLKKKAMELGILCDVPVSLVCYGPDGDLHTWPENTQECKETVLWIKRNTRCNKRLDISTFLETKKNKLGKKTTDKLFERLNQKVVGGLVDAKDLLSLDSYLENKLKDFKERRRLLEFPESKKNGQDKLIGSSSVALGLPLNLDYNMCFNNYNIHAPMMNCNSIAQFNLENSMETNLGFNRGFGFGDCSMISTINHQAWPVSGGSSNNPSLFMEG